MDSGRHVFSVDLLERYAAKGRGVITCMAAGNDVIVLGTSKGWIIRHDFGVGDSSDLDLSAGKTGEQPIHRVFVDPGGSHCIATVLSSGGAETYYTHAKWSKPRLLSRLKGLVVNAVAWNRQQITEASTREVILGTDNGQLYEIAVDEKDKKEKYMKLLFELTELPEAFMGLQMETASVGNATRYYVMAITPTRLYSFTGIGSLDTVFASYSDRAVRFMELPGEIPNSELHFFIKQRRAEHFAWLSGAGIYHGDLNFGAQHSSADGDENFVENKALLDYSKLGEGSEAVKPRSLAVSDFHFLLLIGDKVKVVNRISEQIMGDLQFDHASESVSRGIIGLCSDATAGLFYAYDQNSIFQVSVHDEGRDMWRVYLDMNEYAAALAHCRDPFQRDQVYLVQGETAFSAKDFFRAASFFAKINYILSFEEITLKFISVGEQDALRTFLLRKLDNLAKDDKCQITMISTWATELYLDKINRLLLEDDTASRNQNVEYQSGIKEFRAFLSDCKDVLDDATTMRLLESYGRVDELVYFASLKEHYEIVVHHYIQVDTELAMAEADKVEDDEDLRKKLWLMVAKHVIEQEKGAKRENIRKAIAFLKETDGLLKIEDILPFFPDFALIDDFKEAICSSLEDYNKQIEQLKQEMNDATHGADNIRNDISALAQRYAVIDRDEECGVCRRKILTVGGTRQVARGYTSVGPMAPFYVFPCGHAFHAECLIAHVTGCSNQAQAEFVLDLQKQLSLLGGESTNHPNGSVIEAPIGSMIHADKIRSQLDDAVASECPFCGDLMIREISLPFIQPEEEQQVTSWEIKPYNLGSQRSLSISI
ncbi:vacuolar sorting protein 18 isoform X2 [Telopea speciosissima]|uniref:vacuolar sorting protein 18 isoform X2 n=1 Tax=Telopea speciosissima TaxID=54955 RepID=UPI001CC4432B|nr:vacuolar sorting protein 18 isoform X2 [Telopea speciosissima]